ncbi:MAG: hypothetical protein EA387_10205 [Nitriliruptor sp.]|nr:MAG: hypothetical protein EA387_10205 [Nitriliruptor sp.]
MELSAPSLPTWEQAEGFLLDLAAGDLAAGAWPMPTLLACIDDEAVAIDTLRPFGEEGPVPALVEVLALLLPLGVNRIALLLPGRAWSTLDPIPPVADEGDLRARVLILLEADGVHRPCRYLSRLRELHEETGDGRWRVGEVVAEGSQEAEAPVLDALGILLDRRDELRRETTGSALVAQLGRVLLLGHQLALAPRLAVPLTHASAS